MDAYILHITFESGLFLKNIVDFLTSCDPNNKCCTLVICEDTITVESTCSSFTENRCKFILSLNTNSIKNFHIKYPMNINVSIGKLQIYCKSLKMKDKVVLYILDNKDDDEKIEKMLYISTLLKDNFEIKQSLSIDILPYTAYIPEDHLELFSKNGYEILTTEIIVLKKKIGMKEPPVLIQIDVDNYIEFISTSCGIGPLNILHGNKSDKCSTIKISSNVINIISKLSQICESIIFYTTTDNSPSLKIVCNIKNKKCEGLGEVNIFLKQS